MSQTSAKIPALIGLCPGEHLTHFYMPLDPDESRICPECDCEMVVYAPVRYAPLPDGRRHPLPPDDPADHYRPGGEAA